MTDSWKEELQTPIWTSVVTGGWYEQSITPAPQSSEMPRRIGAGWGSHDRVWHSEGGEQSEQGLMETITKLNIFVLNENKPILYTMQSKFEVQSWILNWKDSIILLWQSSGDEKWMRWEMDVQITCRHRCGWKSKLSPNICWQQTRLKPVPVTFVLALSHIPGDISQLQHLLSGKGLRGWAKCDVQKQPSGAT